MAHKCTYISFNYDDQLQVESEEKSARTLLIPRQKGSQRQLAEWPSQAVYQWLVDCSQLVCMINSAVLRTLQQSLVQRSPCKHRHYRSWVKWRKSCQVHVSMDKYDRTVEIEDELE